MKGYETYWVDDLKMLPELKFDIILASNISLSNIPIIPTARYILHNIKIDDIQNKFQCSINHINLQVFTKDSKGEKIFGIENVLWDKSAKTLYQPWGTPLPSNQWRGLNEFKIGDYEYWLGSIWQNELNQGNLDVMKKYKILLNRLGIKLIRKGGSRILINGLSERKAGNYIRKSVFGATILGEWQIQNDYIPCRLFKNLTYGIPPLSNMNKPNLLSEHNGFTKSVEDLLDFALSEKKIDRKKRFELARSEISKYTYANSIDRIIELL
jgi:hypothetical protein